MPLSVGDARAFRKSVFAKGLCGLFELTQRGYADYAFIGGAQIDIYGNVCSTYEGGTYLAPRVRFPGSVGAMAANCETQVEVLPSQQFCIITQYIRNTAIFSFRRAFSRVKLAA